jgi:hypothetical protein
VERTSDVQMSCERIIARWHPIRGVLIEILKYFGHGFVQTTRKIWVGQLIIMRNL